jgi:hypothetical protein
MRPSAGEAYSGLHRVRTGPTVGSRIRMGDAKGITGPVGPGKDVTGCRRVRTTSLEARHAHTRRSGRPIGTVPSMTATRQSRGDERTHMLSAVLRRRCRAGRRPEFCSSMFCSGRVSVDVSVPLGTARSIHRSMCDHVGALGAAQCCHVGLVDCAGLPQLERRVATLAIARPLGVPAAPPRLAPAIKRSRKHWTLRCLLFRQGSRIRHRKLCRASAGIQSFAL